MSHHLDSPLARQDIRLDITDLYLFRGETGTVFVINVCHSIAGEVPASGYHPEGMYEFKVDLNGDAVEELTYRVTFDERDSAGKQRFVLRRITGSDAVDPNAPGTVVTHGTTGEIATTASGLRLWAGKAGDPFWIEPDVLHAVGHAFQDGTKVDLSGWNPAQAKNLFAGHTVYSIVLEVPDRELLPEKGHNHRIGVWAVSTLATDAGGWRSINRVGLPMIPRCLRNTTRILVTALTRDVRPMISRPTAKLSSRPSPALLLPMELLRTRRPTRRKSLTGSCPTYSPIRSVLRPCLASQSGTVAP
jgi:Domain of unknown function (DUF4331)